MSDGLLQEDYPFLSVRDMSEYYVNSVLQQGDKKYYVIIGWSFGCEVAFEMAKRIIMNQRKVFLVVLDPQIMTERSDNIRICFYEVLKKEYGVSFDGIITLPDLEINSINNFIVELVEHMIASNHIKQTHEKYYVRALRVYLYNLINKHCYQRSGEVPNVLMAVSEKNVNNIFSFMRQAHLLDWQPHAKSIKKVVISGDHYSMLKGISASCIVSEINKNYLEIIGKTI